MIWNYLRSKVRESILAGVSDALVEIEGNGTTGSAAETGNALALLRARLTPALPAPTLLAAGTSAETPIAASTAASGAGEGEGDPSAASAPRNGRKRPAPAG
jgi:hypothetical protein